MRTWLSVWAAFVVVAVGVPLLAAYVQQRHVSVPAVDDLPETRARQRPAPDEVEARWLRTNRLLLLAALAAVVATAWFVIGVTG